MKLADHYNKASIIISISILFISGIIYYAAINKIARDQLDNNLNEEVAEVVLYVNQNHKLPKQVDFDEDQTTFIKTKLSHYKTHYFDAVFNDLKDKKQEQGRAVAALISLNGENYIVTIKVSRENTEYLIQMISIITLLLSAVLLSILFITNKYVLSTLWHPFYKILFQVKGFNVADNVHPEKITSKVDEFQELSNAVITMSSRVNEDYQGLKAFTENASHEMMTPISVITSKLDTLIQDEKLNSDQLSQITDVYSATGKLSRLNQSLLLLVKIDNNLIPEEEELNVKTIVLEKVKQFQELIQNKKIELDYELEDTPLRASKYLVDILINNLFSNAIRHNKALGEIKISLKSKKLIFQNTAEGLPLEQDHIFKRFYKSRSSDGIGLGLAVIKNICNKYQFSLKYQFLDNQHSFIIEF